MSTIPEKRRELDRLRELSKCEGWKDVLLPLIEKRRESHNSAGMAKNSTPEKRAEHVEAFHLATDLIALVPDRIAVLVKELAANEQSDRT